VPGNWSPVLFDNVKVGRNILCLKPTYFKKWPLQIKNRRLKPFTIAGFKKNRADAQAKKSHYLTGFVYKGLTFVLPGQYNKEV